MEKNQTNVNNKIEKKITKLDLVSFVSFIVSLVWLLFGGVLVLLTCEPHCRTNIVPNIWILGFLFLITLSFILAIVVIILINRNRNKLKGRQLAKITLIMIVLFVVAVLCAGIEMGNIDLLLLFFLSPFLSPWK